MGGCSILGCKKRSERKGMGTLFHSWHVRTKENIARVRKDEAEAAAKEKEEQKRIENADREARLGVLKKKAKEKLQDQGGQFEVPETSAGYSQHEHVNLFSDIERSTTGTNKEHELEAKEKKEEYEKQIGYLTYLGQDTNEALGKRNWYELPPETARFHRPDDTKETFTKLLLRDVDGKPRPSTSDTRNGEVSWKTKQTLDPIKSFKHLCSKIPAVKHSAGNTLVDDDGNKHKQHKKDKKMSIKEDKQEKLKKLREARLRRELEERRKARALLAAVSGEPTHLPPTHSPATTLKPKYNSQFNPELARQNYT